MADGSVTEGGEEVQYFPEGSLLNTMIISITDSEKRCTEFIKDPFTVYLIETKYIDGGPLAGEPDISSNLWRRYSEFDLLKNYLLAIYPATIVPPLPEKRANAFKVAADRFDPDFIEKRRIGLEAYGNAGHIQPRISAMICDHRDYIFKHLKVSMQEQTHPKLAKDAIFLGFLQQEEGWKENVHSTQYTSKVDSRLKSLSASVKKPDRQFEDIKHYAENLGTNISAMLKVRQHMSETTFTIHKQHAGYGKTFSEWSTREIDMGDGLQKAGHYMDRLSSSVDGVLEDDETTFADPLKEYLFYAEVLKTVSKKQLLRQYDLEKAEDLLSAKSSQREALDTQKKTAADSTVSQPKTNLSFKGLSSMIFGAESPETLDSKIANLDEQIAEAEANVQTRKEELATFVDEANQDFERFKRQQAKDLKAILAAHVKTQIKLCKLGKSTWENMKDAAQKL